MDPVKELRETIATLKEKQKKLQLLRQVYQTCSKTAALAITNDMKEEAMAALEQMQQLGRRMEGYWQTGWARSSGVYSAVDGMVQSRVNWMQTQQEELESARACLEELRRKIEISKSMKSQPELHDEPFPVEVKLTRGVISYKHPDMEHWVRGKKLGCDYELDQIIKQVGQNPIANEKTAGIEREDREK